MSRHAARLAAFSVVASGGLASALAVSLPARSAALDSTTAATTTAPTVTSAAAEVLAVSGHGWGHGLGMSQWGAYGYALHGYSAARILAHYYPGTTLGPASTRTVRVLLARGKRLSLGSAGAWTAVDATGAKVALDAGTVDLTPSSRLQGHAVTLPVTLSSAAPIALGGKPYRGRIVVAPDGKALEAIDVVALESYVKGVVPAEMPSDWPAAALQAQAVAARSYALANLVQGRAFDLYDDVRSQVYGGIDAESPSSSAAVDATKGQVALYGGKVADTLFFSTSGGRTASAAELLGSPVPYLVSVPDPYDTLSPFHDWGPVLFDVQSVAKKLKLTPPVSGVQVAAGPSGRAQTVTVVGAGDAEASFTGAQVRAVLGLRSTWFSPSLYSLAPQRAAVTYGGTVALTGFVQGASGVALEAKPYGRDWASAGTVTLRSDGSFEVPVSPKLRTSYRLSAGAVRAGLASVTVAPKVVATIATSGVAGSVRPAVASDAVELQKGAGAAWSTVSSTATDAGGRFTFGGPLAPGDYRVRVAPGGGLQPGLSSVVTVP
ncbi:MAG TPA: SpoIID/LytB domain-containing protein [Gaiellaceae bacterium]